MIKPASKTITSRRLLPFNTKNIIQHLKYPIFKASRDFPKKERSLLLQQKKHEFSGLSKHRRRNSSGFPARRYISKMPSKREHPKVRILTMKMDLPQIKSFDASDRKHFVSLISDALKPYPSQYMYKKIKKEDDWELSGWNDEADITT